MATSNHTSNYNLSQYAATDPVKFLTNYNSDMAAIDAALKTIHDSDAGKAPSARTIVGLPLTADIALAQLIAAGLASGTGGKADTAALADNALSLGGHAAGEYSIIESGTWTPTLSGSSATGTPAYSYNTGHYIKIGTLVVCRVLLAISSRGGMSGNLIVNNLPYITENTGLDTSSGIWSGQNLTLSSGFIPQCVYITSNSTSTMLNAQSNTEKKLATAAEVADNFVLKATFSYFTV